MPIRETAEALSLPIHEIDTFTGWTVRTKSSKKFVLPIVLIILASNYPEWSDQSDHCGILRTVCTSTYFELCELRRPERASFITAGVSDHRGIITRMSTDHTIVSAAQLRYTTLS